MRPATALPTPLVRPVYAIPAGQMSKKSPALDDVKTDARFETACRFQMLPTDQPHHKPVPGFACPTSLPPYAAPRVVRMVAVSHHQNIPFRAESLLDRWIN